VSPLSDDPVKRARQLANLQPGAGAGDGGLQRALGHGAYAQVRARRVERREAEIFDALAADAPLRADGALPAHDGAIVALLAQVLCRLEDVAANIRDCGVFEQRGRRKGQLRPVVEAEARLRREAAGYLDQLAMTPKARGALGLDLARTVDLATAMSEPDPARRADLMRAAGVLEGGGPPGA
jgi:hypothetical protein